jgi:hypothetical protein
MVSLLIGPRKAESRGQNAVDSDWLRFKAKRAKEKVKNNRQFAMQGLVQGDPRGSAFSSRLAACLAWSTLAQHPTSLRPGRRPGPTR